MKRICVFCGSNSGRSSRYAESAAALGAALAARGLGLVYGGSRVGLMGTLADAALAAGGDVIGVIPQSLTSREAAHQGVTDLRIVRSMHARKALMADLSDGFIALPGGNGTLDELFEMLTWAQLGEHSKPCGLLNIDGYYASLLAFLDHAVDEQFLKPEHRAMLIVELTPGLILDRFVSYRPPKIEKVIGRRST